MTPTPEILPAVPAADPLARCALFVAFEGMGLLDLTGPLTVFWSATLFMEQQGLHGCAPYSQLGWRTNPHRRRPISRFQNAEIDTIVVPGALDMGPALADRRLVDWLATHAPKARRTASVCADAFLLAEAGLLNGRRAATHWASCELLDQHQASLTVESDAIYIQDGPIWTSAGVSAGIDVSAADLIWVLVIVGVGLVIGNTLGGRTADANQRLSLILWPAAMIASLIVAGFVAPFKWPFLTAAFVFGIACIPRGPRQTQDAA